VPARFFATDGAADDLRLLPEHLRGHTGLAELAEVVEAEILAHFTHTQWQAGSYAFARDWPQDDTIAEGPLAGAYALGDGRYVALRGYHATPALAASALRDALRLEIASVLRWRLPAERRTPGVTSDSDGERAVSYSEAAASQQPFPATFPLHLRAFAIDPVAWSL
jgi:hypothetical protein